MDQNGEAATVSHRLEDTAGPSNTTAAPRLKCLSCRRGCLSIFYVTYCVLYSLPTALFASAKRKPPTPPPPTHSLSSRVHWKSASAWKWCHREKEMKCCENEEHSGVIQHPPSSLPPFRDEAASHPTLSPLLPACCCSGLWDGDVIGCNVSFT